MDPAIAQEIEIGGCILLIRDGFVALCFNVCDLGLDADEGRGNADPVAYQAFSDAFIFVEQRQPLFDNLYGFVGLHPLEVRRLYIAHEIA